MIFMIRTCFVKEDKPFRRILENFCHESTPVLKTPLLSNVDNFLVNPFFCSTIHTVDPETFVPVDTDIVLLRDIGATSDPLRSQWLCTSHMNNGFFLENYVFIWQLISLCDTTVLAKICSEWGRCRSSSSLHFTILPQMRKFLFYENESHEIFSTAIFLYNE